MSASELHAREGRLTQSRPMRIRFWIVIGALLAGVALVSAYIGIRVGRHMMFNEACCQIPPSRTLTVSLREMLRLERFPSQIGQDKWVLEAVFPDTHNGFFLDIGSADGTIGSNSKALEEHGWTGICIEPFPTNMEGRTCRLFRDVVYSVSGKRVSFRAAGTLGGIVDDLGRWKNETSRDPTVEFTTVTLGDILERAHAPHFIHFISLDIEGAELDALRGFPFETYQFGALAVEHNEEEPKRSGIFTLLKSRGYKRVHSFLQDDFYVPDRTGPNSHDSPSVR